MKVAVVGTLSFDDYDMMVKVLKEHFPQMTQVVSGGAKGADTLGADYCKQHLGCDPIEHLPKWKTDPSIPYHVRWYFERNTTIAEDAEMGIGFIVGSKSNGTFDTLDKMMKMGKPVYVCWMNYGGIVTKFVGKYKTKPPHLNLGIS